MADREPLLPRELEHESWNTENIGDVQGNHLFHEVSSTEPPVEPQMPRNNALLKAQGHKAEMERSFSLFAALGLGFRYATRGYEYAKKKRMSLNRLIQKHSITNSWVGYLSCFGQNLAYAGPNSVVFGLCAAVVVQWIISLGLYEIASCFPSSGVR